MSKRRRFHGARKSSAFVRFLRVPRKSSGFGSNAEDLQKTGAQCQKKGKKVPSPAFADISRLCRKCGRIKKRKAKNRTSIGLGQVLFEFARLLKREITGPGYLPLLSLLSDFSFLSAAKPRPSNGTCCSSCCCCYSWDYFLISENIQFGEIFIKQNVQILVI